VLHLYPNKVVVVAGRHEATHPRHQASSSHRPTRSTGSSALHPPLVV
jgi:hypothetical protein